jgi:hypothetical protein
MMSLKLSPFHGIEAKWKMKVCSNFKKKNYFQLTRYISSQKSRLYTRRNIQILDRMIVGDDEVNQPFPGGSKLFLIHDLSEMIWRGIPFIKSVA